MNNKNLKPFKLFALKNFPFIEADFDAITNYELLCKIVEYLNNVIASQNETMENVQNLSNAFNQLYNYVHDYFDTLDVQEEINNKLDEMVEEGTLQEIIADYLNSKAVFGFNTVADLLEATNLINGSYAETLGYYSVNDGGASLYQIVEDIPESGHYETLDNGLYAKLILKDNTLNIRQMGAKGDGVTEDTTIFQDAFIKYNNIYIPNGNYIVNGEISFNSETQVKGESMSETIITSSYLNYLFNYVTDVENYKWNIKSNIKFENFKVVCKYFMNINDDSLAEASWVNQGTILGMVARNLWIYGIYDTLTDENANTNVLPTLTELNNYGIGFNLSSVFDGRFENCRVENFGLAMYLQGCDINVITNNKFNKNGVHIWLDRVSSYGSQTTISNNDMIINKRYGSVRVNATRQDAILNNYFEVYQPCGCHIYADNEMSLLIDGNRLENPQQAEIDVFRLAPINGDIVTNNRMGPNANYKTYINVLPDNYKGRSHDENLLAIIRDNVDCFIIKNYELCLTDFYNPLVLSPTSLFHYVNFPDGELWVSPWISYDNTTGMYAFNNSVGSKQFRYNFNRLKSIYRKPVKIRITYRSSGSVNKLYSILRLDGVDVRTAQDNNVNDGEVHTVEIDYSGTDSSIHDSVRLMINTATDVWIYSVELI